MGVEKNDTSGKLGTMTDTTRTPKSSKPKDASKAPKADAKPREPTAFNKFMAATLKELKETKPELSHKERFKTAAQMWSETHPKAEKPPREKVDNTAKGEFMKETMKRLKAETPNMKHTAAFSEAAKLWRNRETAAA